MKKRKVILLGPTPPPMGGIARYCQDILNSNLKIKYDISFFDVTVPLHLRPSAYTHHTRKNIFIRDGLANVFRQIGFHFKNIRNYRKVLEQKKPDIFHVVSCTGLGFWRNSLFLSLAKKQGIYCIWHIVGEIDVFWARGSWLRKRMITWYLNKADVHVVQSEEIKRHVEKMTKVRVEVMYNGVDVNKFPEEPTHSSNGQTSENIKVVTLGALGKRKGYFDLLKVAKNLRDHRKKPLFYFVGGGEVELFNRLVKEEGLENTVKVTGMIDDGEKNQILDESDIFALPTYNEGQPIALLEGMSAGLAAVSTTVGAIPEVVKELNGFLIKPGDVEMLQSSIEKLLVDDELRRRMGKHNWNESKTKYSLDRVMNQIDDYYSQSQYQ